jgi:hypothetical protein
MNSLSVTYCDLLVVLAEQLNADVQCAAQTNRFGRLEN